MDATDASRGTHSNIRSGGGRPPCGSSHRTKRARLDGRCDLLPAVGRATQRAISSRRPDSWIETQRNSLLIYLFRESGAAAPLRMLLWPVVCMRRLGLLASIPKCGPLQRLRRSNGWLHRPKNAHDQKHKSTQNLLAGHVLAQLEERRG